jgi:hypothetical protein
MTGTPCEMVPCSAPARRFLVDLTSVLADGMARIAAPASRERASSNRRGISPLSSASGNDWSDS